MILFDFRCANMARRRWTNEVIHNTEASTITVNTKAPGPNFPPPKTDKPRPHVCTTCGRAFARLEHLKRHERSHTKEKPFECPECKRCFARRDLLLRHQQKLHQSTAPSSRPRGRRESASGATALGQSRARKNSVAGANPSVPANPAAMRPRANTISVVDQAAMQQFMVAANPAVARMPPNHAHNHTRHNSVIGLPFHGMDHQFSGMSAVLGQRGMQHGLPKLDTNRLSFDTGLRTAPAQPLFSNDYTLDQLFTPTPNTINPNALHYSVESPQTMPMDPMSPPFHGLPDLQSATSPYETIGFENLLISNWANATHDFFSNGNENAIDGSSSSAISTASPGGLSDAMIDGSNRPSNPATTAPVTSAAWTPAMVSPHMTAAFNIDFSNSAFTDLAPTSPHPMQNGMLNDAYFSTTPASMNASSPSVMPGLTSQNLNQAMSFGQGPETPTSINGINHGTSPVSTITDSTRNAILGALSSTATLNLHSTLGNRRPSNTLQTSPLSTHVQAPTALTDASNVLPPTQILQRFVAAYITYFHPHLPFLHIPTLSFELPNRPVNGNSNQLGGPACLVLSMASIGALYEHEYEQARDLFELSKKMIQAYLEQRRIDGMRKSFNVSSPNQDIHKSHDSTADTPVWLVQSMLLNVVYGHNCGDKRASEIASTHCAALVSLAKGAELYLPNEIGDGDGDDETVWLRWKAMEERKRTLYTIFIMSSLLVCAYNHYPNFTNPEILHDLPCDEEFFEAENSAVFRALGGVAGANRNRVNFHAALGDLLSTNTKQRRTSLSNSNDLPPSGFETNAFGCLILINALHNYIWETRQRHHNKVWTDEETDKMHRYIEPALKAWQSIWAKNAMHSMKRPNPYNKGPLSADAIPLLDLAYVRLFVNLDRSKEKFWQRDWEGLSEELARGSEIIQLAEHGSTASELLLDDPMDLSMSFNNTEPPGISLGMVQSQSPTINQTTPRREKILRKAAFYAADSLSMADKLDVTFADLTCRELPLQSAMCAFDSAQVLAEWVATLQDRVGGYLGILGQDNVDLSQVPAIMFLGDEDIQLLRKVQSIVESLERKMSTDLGPGVAGGYAVKLLRVTARMLDRAGVWQGEICLFYYPSWSCQPIPFRTQVVY